MAAACLHLLEHYDGPEQVNVGTGKDATIREIAELSPTSSASRARRDWDTTKPDGTPQKLLDVSKLAEAGWTAQIGLRRASGPPSTGTGSTWSTCGSDRQA